MSDNDQQFNVVVQNEYERVLANPTNVIMSQELEDILASHEMEEIKQQAVILESDDGEMSIEIACSFRSIALLDETHRIELEFGDPALFMRSIMELRDGFRLSISDGLQIKIRNCQLGTWDVFKDIDGFIVGLGVKGEIQF